MFNARQSTIRSRREMIDSAMVGVKPTLCAPNARIAELVAKCDVSVLKCLLDAKTLADLGVN